MLNRLEVLTVMAHLLITLCILGAYVFTIHIGTPDETLKNLLLLIGGYWFGVMGKQQVDKVIQKRKDDAK